MNDAFDSAKASIVPATPARQAMIAIRHHLGTGFVLIMLLGLGNLALIPWQDPRLTIRTQPEDAHVTLHNIDQAYTPGMRLPPGRYHVAIFRPGYVTKTGYIDLTHADWSQWVVLEPERLSQPLLSLQGEKEAFPSDFKTSPVAQENTGEHPFHTVTAKLHCKKINFCARE
ncbi:MAG: PEGA domain-containing protein [Magnetococcales bacterium]|nr:PEGA domain-containing protein [Magnetococcales bacterium]